MAKEYIERGKLESILKNRYDRLAGLTSDFYAGYMLAFLTIKYDVPTAADVAEVRHGRWTIAEDDYYGLNIVKCSVCHEEWCFEERDDVFDLNYHYCPNCGAYMMGENNGKCE